MSVAACSPAPRPAMDRPTAAAALLEPDGRRAAPGSSEQGLRWAPGPDRLAARAASPGWAGPGGTAVGANAAGRAGAHLLPTIHRFLAVARRGGPGGSEGSLEA